MPGTHMPRRRRGRAVGSLLVGALLACLTVVVGPAPSVGAAAIPTPVMGRPVVTAADLVGWFRSTGKVSKATVSIDLLAGYYISEGRDEGVAGDLAFAQSIVETGYFNFSARVPPSYNNFSGLGAVDSGTGAESFPDARTGVRAQIQHLRAYADPTVTVSNLAHPLVDTRFNLVSPKGKAPNWEQFGNGIWATDPAYATKVLSIHDQIVTWARRYGPSRFAPFTTVEPFVRQGFRDLLFREATGGEQLLWQTVLRTGSMTPEAFLAELIRGEGATTTQPVVRLYLASLGRAPDHSGLVYWTRQRSAGMKMDRLAQLLISSPEFDRRFGRPTDAGYVELLYRNVLGRSPDSGGLAYWTGRLTSGSLSRSQMLVQFAESSEHRRDVAYVVEATIVYEGMLLSPAGAEGLGWWLQHRTAGESLESLTFHALQDPRFAARF